MENKKPKIALCLSGKIRNSMFCFPYIYDNFIANNHNVDVFIHTWDESRVIKMYKSKKFQIESEDDCLNLVFPKLNFNGVYIDNYVPESGSYYNDIRIPGYIKNTILMFYSIKKCFELIDKDEYDLVIRCRFDLVLQQKIDLMKIINSIQLKEYGIYIPCEKFNYGGYNDQIAIGDYESMKVYSETILNINQFIFDLKRWHPETFLKKQIDDNNVKVYQEDINYAIVKNVKIECGWPNEYYDFKNE